MIFLLAEIDGREQDPNIEFDIVMCNSLKIRLDEQTIGYHVLEPFTHPEAQAFGGGPLQHDLAVLQRISRPPAHPKGITGCSFGMSGRRQENEEPRLFTDHAVEAGPFAIPPKIAAVHSLDSQD